MIQSGVKQQQKLLKSCPEIEKKEFKVKSINEYSMDDSLQFLIKLKHHTFFRVYSLQF